MSIVALVVSVLGTVAGFVLAGWHFHAVVARTRCDSAYLRALGVGFLLAVSPPVLGTVLGLIGFIRAYRGKGTSVTLPTIALIVSVVMLFLAVILGLGVGLFLVSFNDDGQSSC